MTRSARRSRLILLAGVGLAAGLLLAVAFRALVVPARSTAARVDPRPNVVVLMTDNQTIADLE